MATQLQSHSSPVDSNLRLPFNVTTVKHFLIPSSYIVIAEWAYKSRSKPSPHYVCSSAYCLFFSLSREKDDTLGCQHTWLLQPYCENLYEWFHVQYGRGSLILQSCCSSHDTLE